MKKTDTPLITGQESEKELKESNNKQKKDEQTINNENTKVKFKTEIINKDININNSYEKEKNPRGDRRPRAGFDRVRLSRNRGFACHHRRSGRQR